MEGFRSGQPVYDKTLWRFVALRILFGTTCRIAAKVKGTGGSLHR